MLIGMLAGFAEFERNLIGERTRSALAYKKKHRQVFNHIPFGFKRDGTNLVPLEAEQAVILRMRELRAAGLPFAKISSALNAEGIATKKAGGRWFASTVNQVLSNMAISTFEKAG